MTFVIATGVRKSTRSDARYLSTDPLFSTYWTPERDRELGDLCRVSHLAEIARFLKIPGNIVRRRVDRLGLEPLTQQQAGSPTEGEWLGAATRAATRAAVAAGLNPVHILRGSRATPHVRARWKAWKAILEENPGYSIKGVALISGHHHTSILHGLRQLRKGAAKP